jgi:hypothetical protein
MKRVGLVNVMLLAFGIGFGVTPTSAVAQEAKTVGAQEPKGKTCRMEQQCHWVNFKKICTYVKVCR